VSAASARCPNESGRVAALAAAHGRSLSGYARAGAPSPGRRSPWPGGWRAPPARSARGTAGQRAMGDGFTPPDWRNHLDPSRMPPRLRPLPPRSRFPWRSRSRTSAAGVATSPADVPAIASCPASATLPSIAWYAHCVTPPRRRCCDDHLNPPNTCRFVIRGISPRTTSSPRSARRATASTPPWPRRSTSLYKWELIYPQGPWRGPRRRRVRHPRLHRLVNHRRLRGEITDVTPAELEAS
jgi:hypothetical protein